jgi:heptosyltransferase II
MTAPQRILILQTSWIGDVILTLPLLQAARNRWEKAHIAFVAVPVSAEVVTNHPAVDEIVLFDKRGKDAGLNGMRSLVRRLAAGRYDVALVPHRSLRSALAACLSRVPRRIGFRTSAGRLLFTDLVEYQKDAHEIRRNLALLAPLGGASTDTGLPDLFPTPEDRAIVDRLVGEALPASGNGRSAMIALAPGSIWETKRWPKERFLQLAELLIANDFIVALIGGPQDSRLCNEIQGALRTGSVVNGAGRLALLQSAELIRRCKALVTNDSAPMHLAVAVRTPVVAIFGATVPQFGFAPLGEHDQIVETPGLACRPCSIHGGRACPVGTFECMMKIAPSDVLASVNMIVARPRELPSTRP